MRRRLTGTGFITLTLALSACGDDGGPRKDDGGADASAPEVDAGSDAGAAEPDAGSEADAGAQEDAGQELDASDGEVPGESPAERGRYLVDHVAACGDCHTPRKVDGAPDLDKYLAGVECFVDADPADPAVGCLSSRNLTNHETGLKNRSDDEIKDMFTKGLRPDGKALHPVMPYWVLGNMTDADADAIVAYLRSVPAVEHMLPPAQAPFAEVPAPAPRWPEAAIPAVGAQYEAREAAERGRYLAGNVGICMECHTPHDEQDAPVISKAFQGGRAFPRGLLGLPPIFPEVIYSSNLTPHTTGIAGYDVEGLVRALKQGVDKDDHGLCPPMPAGPMAAFGGLTDDDARDIAHYLLSLAPADNAIPGTCTPPSAP